MPFGIKANQINRIEFKNVQNVETLDALNAGVAVDQTKMAAFGRNVLDKFGLPAGEVRLINARYPERGINISVEVNRGGNVSNVPLTSTVGDLRAAGLKDAHHVIQDAAVRDLPGYNTHLAPGVQLPGPSTTVGTPHYIATQVQRQAGGGTLAAEMRIGYKALRQAGYSESYARQMIAESDAYFRSIGASPLTSTRIPGNRK